MKQSITQRGNVAKPRICTTGQKLNQMNQDINVLQKAKIGELKRKPLSTSKPRVTQTEPTRKGTTRWEEVYNRQERRKPTQRE